MSAVYVYRLYDKRGRLLYVGQSKDPFTRYNQHLFTTTWWAVRVVRGVFRVYPSRAAALAAEQQAIITEKPLHNRNHFGHISRRAWTQQDYVDMTRARMESPFGTLADDKMLATFRGEYRGKFGRELGDDVGVVRRGFSRANPDMAGRPRRIA